MPIKCFQAIMNSLGVSAKKRRKKRVMIGLARYPRSSKPSINLFEVNILPQSTKLIMNA